MIGCLKKFKDITCVILGVTLLNTKFQEITCVIYDLNLLNTKVASLYLTGALYCGSFFEKSLIGPLHFQQNMDELLCRRFRNEHCNFVQSICNSIFLRNICGFHINVKIFFTEGYVSCLIQVSKNSHINSNCGHEIVLLCLVMSQVLG